MKLTSKEARNILEIERKTSKNDRWIEHCICVGDTAGRIAQALKDIKETYKLKEYFDSLLGYNLYDLFPEIKNNL